MEPQDSDLFTIPHYTVRYLRAGDEALIYDLLQRCEEFSRLVSGQPPEPEEAAGLLVDLPPGKSLADKFSIGVFNGPETLIGLVDLIRGYPRPEVWFIGLMQLDPAYQGRGIGKQLYQAVESWSAQQGAREMMLGVVAQNVDALAFWEKLGFQVVDQKPGKFGLLETTVLVMQKTV